MISAATIGNRREDGSAGTTTGAGTSSGWPVSRNPAPVRHPHANLDLGAEVSEQPLGGGSRLASLSITVVAPGRREACQQHRRL
jgi:hypothetical protein